MILSTNRAAHQLLLQEKQRKQNQLQQIQQNMVTQHITSVFIDLYCIFIILYILIDIFLT